MMKIKDRMISALMILFGTGLVISNDMAFSILMVFALMGLIIIKALEGK